MRQVEGESGELFPCGGSISEEMLFSEAVFSDLLYNHDFVSHAAEPGYVDESPFGCDGDWWIWKYGEDGTRYLTTECIENLMLFIPFTILLFWTAGKKILKKTTFLNIVWTGLKITFVFSLSIELLQLFLRLGTFQVSDLTYNTLGGGIGGAVYWIGHQLSVRRGAE